MRERKKRKWRVATVKVSYKPERGVSITCPKDAYNVFREMWDDDLINLQEQMCAIFLDRASNVIGFKCLHTGSSTATVIDVKLIVTLCCNLMADGVILCHNHPSGNLKASKSDFAVTQKVRQALFILDVKLVDHLIITDRGYNSIY